MTATDSQTHAPEVSGIDGPSIGELAESRLHRHSYLALKNVSCDYRDGTLSLRGCLPSYYLKQVAQEAVFGMEGVERLENRIEVLAPARHPAVRS